jgi:PncC family amidohydrolase
MSKTLEELLHERFIASGKTLVAAESCTGGALAARLTRLPGASRYFLGSLVVYSNAFKSTFLGVKESTLARYGAVSEETVKELLEGLLDKTAGDVAVAVSGIAGPSGATVDKPVGTVFFGIQQRGKSPLVVHLQLKGDREAIIASAVDAILNRL